MRKWMSERLKRRKKPADDTGKQATKAPEPLQPRFYDNETAVRNDSSDATSEGPATGVRDTVLPIAEAISHETEAKTANTSALATVSAEQGQGSVSRPRVSRRRRGRGGRGGSRSRTGGAAASPSPGLTVEPSSLITEASAAGVSTGETASAEQAQATQVTVQGEQSGTQLPAAAVAAPRASKGTVVLAIGLPGSGKSSWFKRHNIHPLSSDLLRELLFDDAQEQRFQDLVFSNLRSMLKARLIARRPMNYVDATNLTPHDRHSWIKLAKDYGYDVQGLFFDVPLEVCMERHQRRGRVVPDEIMRKMAGKLKPPTFDEGFSKITVVRVKQKEAAAG